MQRYFNTEGQCEPKKHYMVRLDDRLEKIKRLFVDRGKYFIINRGRQYGKTTTLRLLAEFLKDDYVILSMDFQMMSSANFADEQTFVISFMEYVERVLSAKKDTIEPVVFKEGRENFDGQDVLCIERDMPNSEKARGTDD